MDAEFTHDFTQAEFFLEANLKFRKLQFVSFEDVCLTLSTSDLDDFEVAGTQIFRVLGVPQGLTEFIPTTFEKYFFSVTHNLLHSCLI